VDKVTVPKTFVVDFSSPNVAKPMHVGHIRSTVIGDAIARILRFVGHRVITDNHLGDWGTQFGMILYGYKHFVDMQRYRLAPVEELARLYKLVRQFIDFHQATAKLPEAELLLTKQRQALQRLENVDSKSDSQQQKKLAKDRAALNEKIAQQTDLIAGLKRTILMVESNEQLNELAAAHASVGEQVLRETADLHAGDSINRALWKEFLPACRQDIQRVYDRLGIEFDYELGESFYQDQLADVVASIQDKNLARTSEGALCVFLDGFETPMIIRKQDGAFLYSTTDLATLKYRLEQWQADTILYVVDHRQHEHFEKLFAAARLWGYEAEFHHLSFGTVLGDDGKPFKTRSGDTVGLEGLLDEAEARARQIAAEQNPELDAQSLDRIAQVVGIGGLKYADLSQNRLSDYKFSFDKMLALKGNTATYLQYGYARVYGILRKGNIDLDELRARPVAFVFAEPIERKLGLQLVRFSEALEDALAEFKPNVLASYLFDMTQVFFQFFEQCPVLKAGDPELRGSRLQFCDLMGRTLEKGLSLLGIEVLEQM
jgi:arginyl-tRNA synthetase